MPTYEYSCPACGSTFEALRKVSERDQPIACPSCGGETLRGLSTPALMMGGLTRTEPTWRPSPDAKPMSPRTMPKPMPATKPSKEAGKGSTPRKKRF
jgi:putative FmdB family regulatory protein